MFRNIYGLDLGTYEIKIYDKRRDRIRSAKNVIAIRDEKIFCGRKCGLCNV